MVEPQASVVVFQASVGVSQTSVVVSQASVVVLQASVVVFQVSVVVLGGLSVESILTVAAGGGVQPAENRAETMTRVQNRFTVVLPFHFKKIFRFPNPGIGSFRAPGQDHIIYFHPNRFQKNTPPPILQKSRHQNEKWAGGSNPASANADR